MNWPLRSWKQRRTECRKAKEETERKEEHRVKLLRFQGRSRIYFSRPGSNTGICLTNKLVLSYLFCHMPGVKR